MQRNRNARIMSRMLTGSTLEVETKYRDKGSLTACVSVQERADVLTGRSLMGLSIRTSERRTIKLTGAEARTLYRVLNHAVNGC